MKKRLIMILLLTFAIGCGQRYIENTRIPDTPQTRRILNLMEKYRKAIEQRDVKTLGAMVSRRYYENAGTTATSDDDYGYNGLIKKVFPYLKDNVKAVQYRLKIKSITFPKKDEAHVEFEYTAKVLISVGEHQKWIFKDDFDRMDFVKEDGVWRIVRGM